MSGEKYKAMLLALYIHDNKLRARFSCYSTISLYSQDRSLSSLPGHYFTTSPAFLRPSPFSLSAEEMASYFSGVRGHGEPLEDNRHKFPPPHLPPPCTHTHSCFFLCYYAGSTCAAKASTIIPVLDPILSHLFKNVIPATVCFSHWITAIRKQTC